MRALAVSILLATCAGTASAGGAADVPYPAAYRDWHHVKSMVINQGHALYDTFGGIHHLSLIHI